MPKTRRFVVVRPGRREYAPFSSPPPPVRAPVPPPTPDQSLSTHFPSSLADDDFLSAEASTIVATLGAPTSSFSTLLGDDVLLAAEQQQPQ